MSNLELVFFLVGGVVTLALVLWSLRIRDLERRGQAKVPFLFGLFYALLFVTFAGRAGLALIDLDALQRLAAGLTAGSFSASAILMFSRAYQMRRSAA